MTETTRYLTCAETAQLVRAALKEAFPGVKFSVRSSTYSGGASITVSYVDGPTQRQVETITRQFEGADFDGMRDLKTYRDSTLDGERISFGADFIFANRVLSPELRQRYEKIIEDRTGEPFEDNRQYRFGWQGRGFEGWGSQLIWQLSCHDGSEESEVAS